MRLADHSSGGVLWSVCVCDTEASIMRGPWLSTRLSTMGKKNPISDNKLLSLDQGVTLLLLFAG